MKFEKIVKVSPAFDKRHPEPSKNYGIDSCKITFYLKGENGAVQFMIGTDWYLPHVQSELKNKDFDIEPRGWDVGYHSYKPFYEGQHCMGKCEMLEFSDCYYDGSSLRAEEWIDDFLKGGTEWLWPKLEEYYNEVFNVD